MERPVILELKHITKTYPGVVALDDINVKIRKGEVLAVAGENGAGKSTMMKLISGAICPDGGSIVYEGKEYEAMTPALSKELGITVVYQEFNLVSSLSVAENMFLGDYPGGKVMPDFRYMKRKTREIFDDMGIDIDPSAKVGELSTSYCQLVEIAKAMTRELKVLILDEPTAALTVHETEILFRLIEKLKKKGTTILYVSHRMSEMFEICDRVVIFRDGRNVGVENMSEITMDGLIQKMVGHEVSDTYPRRKNEVGEVILKVENICGLGVEDISFELHKGEILGFSGLVGAGRTETMRMLFGADRYESGTIYFEGRQVEIRKPEDACDLGIGFVPEDRKTQGVAQNLSIRQNISLAILKLVSSGPLGVMNFQKENKILERYKSALSIKTPSFNQLVKNLSGGNQQKVVLSKWLARNCKVLIVDEPTRGIDVGAKQEIYEILNDLAEQGVAIIMVSSEMPELIGMADRIIVLSEGRKTGVLNREEFEQERILKLSSHEFKEEGVKTNG
ncbi:MAG: sugar ABC transporter ATP-binding protein [Eubacteriales bacterium]|nr:sugar ABC transporter ATP-binding protein [Eubacteriales bacterium]